MVYFQKLLQVFPYIIISCTTVDRLSGEVVCSSDFHKLNFASSSQNKGDLSISVEMQVTHGSGCEGGDGKSFRSTETLLSLDCSVVRLLILGHVTTTSGRGVWSKPSCDEFNEDMLGKRGLWITNDGKDPR